MGFAVIAFSCSITKSLPVTSPAPPEAWGLGQGLGIWAGPTQQTDGESSRSTVAVGSALVTCPRMDLCRALPLSLCSQGLPAPRPRPPESRRPDPSARLRSRPAAARRTRTATMRRSRRSRRMTDRPTAQRSASVDDGALRRTMTHRADRTAPAPEVWEVGARSLWRTSSAWSLGTSSPTPSYGLKFHALAHGRTRARTHTHTHTHTHTCTHAPTHPPTHPPTHTHTHTHTGAEG